MPWHAGASPVNGPPGGVVGGGVVVVGGVGGVGGGGGRAAPRQVTNIKMVPVMSVKEMHNFRCAQEVSV